MPSRDLEQVVRSVDQRLTKVEQILPALATREQVKADIAAAIAPLATKDELRWTSEADRHHTTVLYESLHDDIRIVAEWLAAINERLDREAAGLRRADAEQDARITRFEAFTRNRPDYEECMRRVKALGRYEGDMESALSRLKALARGHKDHEKRIKGLEERAREA